MIKKVYDISGFDCASCAAKSENHLNKRSEILSCRIDFARNKLYLSFKNEELSIDQIKAIIQEVESDELEIVESDSKMMKGNPVITKDMIFIFIRVVIAAIIVLVTALVFEQYEDGITAAQYWIRFSLFLSAYLIAGYDIVIEIFKKIIKLRNPIDEHLLMLVAAGGAFVLASLYTGDYVDGCIVLLLFQIGEIVEAIASNRSKNAIMNAVNIRVDMANRIKGDEIESVLPEEIQVGDVVIVKTGEVIPVDGVVLEGDGDVDTSSLTGEYKPVRCVEGSQIFSGCLLRSGKLTIRVTTPYESSTYVKVMQLITESGEKKSKADLFITIFARWYTPLVMIVAVLFGLIGGLVTHDFPEYIYRGLEFLVASCPCAIVISVPLAYFSSIGLASKNGIVIKGSAYIDKLVKIKKLVTDKTGTITHGTFAIKEVQPVNISSEDLLSTLRAIESLSNHPIAKAVCHGHNMKSIALEVKDFNEISGMGVMATYKGDKVIAGNKTLLEKYNIAFEEVQSTGTRIYIAINNEYKGYVILSDEVKETAQPMVDLLHQEGVSILLLTGDKEEIAKETCLRLGIDEWKAELLPEDKVHCLQETMDNTKGTIAYIGDGINDAASIKMSDVGFAMGGVGSDIAVENADVVIMNDDPAKVYDAIKIAKYGQYTAIFNVVFALVVKLAIMVISALGLLNGLMWVAVLADTGLTVLLVINSLLILYRKVNRKVKAPSIPGHPDYKK